MNFTKVRLSCNMNESLAATAVNNDGGAVYHTVNLSKLDRA